MKTRLWRRLSAGIAAALFVASWSAGAQQIRFVDGDPGTLKCRLVKVESCTPEPPGCLISIEVTNQGTYWAEPVSFEIRGPGITPWRIRRTAQPAAQRAGRGVRPGGKETYVIPSTNAPTRFEKSSIAVSEASFFEGAPIPQSPVRVTALRPAKAKSKDVPIDVMKATLENNLDQEVEVLLLAVYERPKKGRLMHHRRLKALEKVDVQFDEIFLEEVPETVSDQPEFVVDVAQRRGAVVTSLKVVDWSVRYLKEPQAATPAASGPASRGAGPFDSPAARELREAWAVGWRHPSNAVTLRGRFHATNNGDAVWMGEKVVNGRFKLLGYAGGSWTSYEIDVDGDFPTDRKKALAAVVDDRLRMWRYRDFGARQDFDSAFAGAAITMKPGVPKTYVASAGLYEEVTVREGRVVGFRLRGGLPRSLTWTPLAAGLVATSARTGVEECTAIFTKVSDRLVPSRMEFIAVFGKDWGPEVVELTNLAIE